MPISASHTLEACVLDSYDQNGDWSHMLHLHRLRRPWRVEGISNISNILITTVVEVAGPRSIKHVEAEL